MQNQTKTGLPFFSKLMFYGLCGFFCEVVFTAAWYFFDPKYNHGWKLHGCTSLWSFPIYSISIYILEKISLYLNSRIALPFRMIVYIAWTYSWEFSTGLLLRQLNACPWNYEDYTSYHIHGLVTFDYAPFWVIGLVLCEKLVINSALSLQYTTSTNHHHSIKAD